MQRVIAYMDGFNLYYGLRSKGWKHLYWLNLQQVALNLLRPDQTLIATKYFTTKISSPPSKQHRQNIYLEALGTLPDFQIYYGHYLKDMIKCRRCGYEHITHHEKMTDVNIAMELLSDAFQDAFDVALLISADSDLVGPLAKIASLFPRKRAVVVFPPGRQSHALKTIATAYTYLGRNLLAKSLFPDQVTKPDGFVLQRPSSWR